MITQVFASAVFGIDAVPITIEVHIDAGIGYHLVGLPDNAVKESNYRIAAALTNTNYKLPGKRITINLAPADLRKEWSAYDLPIAIGILAADGQINALDLDKCCMMGELTLDGHLRPIKGVLPIAVQAKASGFQSLIVPSENAKEATVVDGLDVYGFNHIKDIPSHPSTRSSSKNSFKRVIPIKLYSNPYLFKIFFIKSYCFWGIANFFIIYKNFSF